MHYLIFLTKKILGIRQNRLPTKYNLSIVREVDIVLLKFEKVN